MWSSVSGSAPSVIIVRLQGELLAIIEEAVQPSRPMSVDEVLAEVRKLGLRTPDEATAWIRAARDAR
jgi:hypothetical protein